MKEALISAGGQVAGGLIGGLLNRSAVREANAQNLMIQEKEWRRQDNAYQRLAEDLEKAGFSKNIVSGVSSGAGTGTNYREQALSYDDISNALSKGVDTFLNVKAEKRADLESSKTLSLLDKRLSEIDEVIKGLVTDNGIKLQHLEQEKNKTIQEGYRTELLLHNLNFYNKNKNLPVGSWYGTPEMLSFVKGLDTANKIVEGVDKNLAEARSKKAEFEARGLPSYVVDRKTLSKYIEGELGLKGKEYRQAYNSLMPLLAERNRAEANAQLENSWFGKKFLKNKK